MLQDMIARITGVVAEVGEGSAILDRDGMGYEVLVPRYAIGELTAARGKSITLHTLEYVEGNPGGGNLIPRLVGFPSVSEMRFFELFTRVKGIGMRKALRALSEPVARIAAAIESSDAKLLGRLPGIGARTADQIVAELRGKVSQFVFAGPAGAARPQWSQPQRDALDILTALGERRHEAEQWVARVAETHPHIQAAEDIVKAAYRLRSGA